MGTQKTPSTDRHKSSTTERHTSSTNKDPASDKRKASSNYSIIMKQPPVPVDAKNQPGNRLTKSLLEQHEAYHEIDPNDQDM